jgi:SNF2 family DNA or RNA helicase
MNMPLNIRELVRRGPSDRDDVQVIVAVAMREVSGGYDDLKQRLSEALMEMLEPLMEEGHKVLVFSQFVGALDIIQAAIEERQW